MRKIGRYLIKGLLGRGGMGKVFKVELPPIKKIAALKLLDPDPLLTQLMGYKHLHNLFLKEAVTMAGLRHPNIVDIHDFDKHQEKPFYVMDFLANNLGAMMGESYMIEAPSRILQPDRALDYVGQTLDGLCCLHNAGIIHRDIKPFNLLVTNQDRVRICDFGLSKLRGERFSGPANLNVGSPYYAAPEQESDPNSVDFRTDLYPVGVMLYRMLSGRLPIIDTKQFTYRPLKLFNPDLDNTWDVFIQKAIALKPDQRFTNALAMRKALHKLEEHWRYHKEKTCRLTQPFLKPQQPAYAVDTAKTFQLRCHPVKASRRQAARLFNVDALWRPTIYSENRLQRHKDQTVTDHAHGLCWQQSGTEFPCSWHQANQYIEHLNTQRFAGCRNWRMPTVDELLTLLTPTPQAEALCIAPVFNPKQRRLWSIDRHSFLSAYYVDIDLGFVGWHDFDAPDYVRAVTNDFSSCNQHRQPDQEILNLR